ncbi:MAG: hypothetical protein QXT64_02275 [Desulfurococcaceae archaeon]
MIVRIERGQNAFWVDIDGKEMGVFEDVYIDGESIKADNDWQAVYLDAVEVYIASDAVFIRTVTGVMHDTLRSLIEAIKHG